MRAERKSGGFLTRVLTALAIGVVLIASALFGRLIGLAVVVAAIAALAAAELYAITRREHRLPNEIFGLIAVAAMPLAAAARGLTGLAVVVSALVIASLSWHLAIRRVTLADTAATVFGAVYVGFTLSHLVLIRQLDGGSELVLLVLLGVWANDVFAYLVGSAMGRHKMAPHISPNKSWEGFVGGTLANILVWVGGYFVIHNGMSLAAYAIIGAVVSVAAVIGDLAESRLKREANVKDSGTWLPGHGGFLDRFDSLIMVSIVAYYLLVFFTGGIG